MNLIALMLILWSIFIVRKQMFDTGLRLGIVSISSVIAVLLMKSTLGLAPAVVMLLAVLMFAGIAISMITVKK
ncbi:hypothetical protein SOPP22_15090 [Shewanella sp. OPT22]|nr:hypothetical protein SOPP22_15090 [Shewanella sp. OPT22]